MSNCDHYLAIAHLDQNPEICDSLSERKLRQLLAEVGVSLTGFYYCPHHPDGIIQEFALNCSCRKPQPGMLLDAANKHGIDMQQSWFIGDILNDVEAGRRAGCRTILIDNGNETQWQLSPERSPHYTVADLGAAARVITSVDMKLLYSLPFVETAGE